MPDRNAAGSSDAAHYAGVPRIILRPVGSGLPLGFFSFWIGMLLLGTQSLGWIRVDEQRNVGMIIATLFAFLARDTLGRRRSASHRLLADVRVDRDHGEARRDEHRARHLPLRLRRGRAAPRHLSTLGRC